MSETGLREKRFAMMALVAGLALAALAGVGGWAAAGVLLAQPVLALGVSWRRGTRVLPMRGAGMSAEILPLLMVWTMGFTGMALLLVWPLPLLLRNGSLTASLGVSVAAGLALIALWRTWRLWRSVECESGAWRTHLHTLSQPETQNWRGLAVAVPIALILGGGLLLAWPGLLPIAMRWPLALAHALALPLLHWLAQHLAMRSGALPVIEMQPKATPEAAPVTALAAGDLDAQLHEAARNGRVEHALELLETGANAHAAPPTDSRDQRGLAALAAVLPDLRLLRALIAHGIDLNPAHTHMTPLLAATRDSWHGRPDAVTMLLANGADPRVADAEGNTPLHHAARSSDPGVVALLCDAAAEIDALNAEGLTPLGVACVAGNWRLAKFLLEHGAKPEPAGGQPVLLAAAATEEDDPAGVQLLLKHKAKVTTRDAHGRSALHEAALAGHAEIIGVLIAAGADVQASDNEGRTPWLDAARSGQVAALEKLREANADLHAVDAQGRNAMMQVCATETVSPAAIRRVLEWGVAPDLADAQGTRAIDLVAAAGRWSVVTVLDPGYALPATVASADDDDKTALPDRAPLELLHDALHENRFDGMAALTRLCSAQELGSLLHNSRLQLSPATLEWLMAHGAPAETRNSNGDNVLFALFAQGVPAIASIQALLNRGLSPAGAGGLSRFLAACSQAASSTHEAETCALQLLERGADPFAASPQGDPALSLAVRMDAPQLIERLLDLGIDRETRDRHGLSALHLAAALGRMDTVKQLVAKGASPNAHAADGQTPLGVALANGRRDLADWLDWHGWPLPKRALCAADLPAAAKMGDIDAVRKLIELGFAIDSTDTQGCTALLRAAGGGHRAVVNLLLAHGADTGHAANTGATPLSAAASMRHADIVDTLLHAGAKIEHRLPGGVTALMLAAALGLPDITARLIAANADVHASDAQGLTPLHCAALYGFVARDGARLVALFDILLLAGADPGSVAAGSVTPLLLLLGSRAEPGTACDEDVVLVALDRLLEENVALDVRDPRGFGPLHLAALHGLLRVVQRLMRAGADPQLRDGLNRSPREIALMRGFVDIAAQFDPIRPGHVPAMAKFLRDPQA
jgi:ankyrin repeat protein